MRQRVKGYLKTVFHPAYALDVRSITKKNLPFLIGWVCIFIWLYSFFLPIGGFRFESELYNRNVGNTTAYYYVWLVSGCLFPILFRSEKYVSRTVYSVAATLAAFFALRFTGDGVFSRIIMLIAAVCIGHIFASVIYGFVMILNNSEKFFSMILAVLLPRVLIVFKPVLNGIHTLLDLPSAIILAIMITLGICSAFYRNEVGEKIQPMRGRAPAKAYALMPLSFVVLAVDDVVAPASLAQITGLSAAGREALYLCGILVGIVAVVFVQRQFSVNICNMLNLSFALLAVGFVIEIISFQIGSAAPAAAVLFGVSYAVGIVNLYYLAGFMAKKFQSIVFYRAGILLAGIYCLTAFTVMKVFGKNHMLSPEFMALSCVCIVVLFFLLTPFFVKMLYTGEWIEDSYRPDVTRCSRLEAKLTDHGLTSAEMSVCGLLLEGYTLRQISGIQSKAYATINTYCTSIYRKLKINSRAELLILLQDYIKK